MPQEVVEITVVIPLDLVEPIGNCRLCGGSTVSTDLMFIFPERDPIVRSSSVVPGFRCQDCEAEYFNGQATKILLEAVVPILVRLERQELLEAVKDQIKILT